MTDNFSRATRSITPTPRKGFDKGTMVRTVLLFLVWLNVLLEQMGLQPVPVLSEESVALGITFVISIWAWFKNNYITLKGKKQQTVIEKNDLK